MFILRTRIEHKQEEKWTVAWQSKSRKKRLPVDAENPFVVPSTPGEIHLVSIDQELVVLALM